ncbi:peroxisome biogenesis factor 10 [Culicoides brevitarsis]|uniref:peroxisome biogenesis factor 10 n=1 Tax=Culicoides brevitarsis TaxID=469753 RepID=UPI00307BE356
MSLFLSKAGQAEIIRSAQKDNQFIEEVHLTLSELFRRYSHTLWIKFDKHLRTAVQIFYYSYHALLGIQTVGEEYTGIVQIDNQFKKLPNRLLQVLCVTLEYAGELAVKKVITVIKKDVQSSTSLLPRAKILLTQFLETLIDVIPFVQMLHRGFFYLYGNKYQLSKRITGINYVLVRYWLKKDHSVLGYKLLGAITLLQAVITAGFYVKKRFRTQKNEILQQKNDFSGIKSESGKTCVLCMDVRTNVSAIRCGHLFCYDCIVDWLKTKNECPVCRDPAKPSNVIFLRNYQGI